MMRCTPPLLLWLWLLPALVGAGTPESWIPARWDGGPLEVTRRAQNKALTKPEVREAIAKWYDPATLSLLDGTPVNCLLLTFSGDAGPEIKKQQRQLVSEYAAKARARGLAVLGIVYPGSEASAVASAAVEAQLDGLVLDGEFPGGLSFAEQLEKTLRSSKSGAIVIPLAAGSLQRRATWAVRAVEGVSPGVGRATEATTASATAGLWIDSNVWLVRSLRPGADRRPVWISHRPNAESPGNYLKSIADAAAAGGRWIVTLEDGLRARLLRRDPAALAEWREIGTYLTFFEQHAKWRGFAPFGNVGIILDTAGPNLEVAEEYLNLVARRQIPYRVLDRSRLNAASFTGLRAVLAFDLAPPTEAERKLLRAFAAEGGLVMIGPSWGSAPKEQSYTMLAVEQGEVAVYKDEAPDPESVARDINDLVPTPDLGVSVFNAPSVLSYVSRPDDGKGLLIQLVNYATAPGEDISIWITGRFSAARMLSPGSEPLDLAVRRSGSRTEITVPKLAQYGAVIVE
jgi:hypothetical protein